MGPTADGANNTTPSAAQAGWRASRYNIAARIPHDEQGRLAVTNLFRGSLDALSEFELMPLAMLDELPATHPGIERLARRGILVNFDEKAALQSLARIASAPTGRVNLTICPTMGCNFDCPYCFEGHTNVRMTPEVADDVLGLTERMMDAAGATNLTVMWFGGEPLLAPDVIETLSARLASLAKARGAAYGPNKIITNGYLLTPEVVAMLEEARVERAQVTLDGIGATHDATRHTVGGAPTFERIVANLSRPGIPFRVTVRHNVYEGNRDESDALRQLVHRIARESGNDLRYVAVPVFGSEVAERRGKQVDMVDVASSSDIQLSQRLRLPQIAPIHCGACNLFDVSLDARGRLYKCGEAVDKPERSFGHAATWDPANPILSASAPDCLTRFLNFSSPLNDNECNDCLWLPVCAGGCPYQRLYREERTCLPYKAEPERYVLALWRDRKALVGSE